jgi:hypothetical protein
MRDITDLTKPKPPQAEADKARELTERMNALIDESDRELINTWHPHRRRRVWPKGISK